MLIVCINEHAIMLARYQDAQAICSSAVCTLQVHQPISTCPPPFLLTQKLSPEDIAGSHMIKLKGNTHALRSYVFSPVKYIHRANQKA